MRNRRVVVTGGAKLVGSNIAPALDVDDAIAVVDRISRGRDGRQVKIAATI